MSYVLHKILRDLYISKRKMNDDYKPKEYHLNLYLNQDWLVSPDTAENNKINPYDSIAISYESHILRIYNEIMYDEEDFDGRRAQCIDKHRVGELFFLLAAKLKYDALRKDNEYSHYLYEGVLCDCGRMLHSFEIDRVRSKWGTRTTAENSIKRKAENTSAFKALYNKINSTPIVETKKAWLLSSNGQVYDLVNFTGNYSNLAAGWLCALPENVTFMDNGGNQIEGVKLRQLLDVLFGKCLFDEDELIKQYRQLGIKGKLKKILNTDLLTEKAPDDKQFVTFCNNIKYEASEHLTARLYGKEPISMVVEIGLVDDSNKSTRSWNILNIAELLNLHGKYILSSDTGFGKTIFLRDLQLNILKSDYGLIPIFLDADNIANFNLSKRNTSTFLKQVAQLFDGYLGSENVEHFLLKYRERIVFLIDGLDQIDGYGTTYVNLAEKILTTISDKIVIASRPSAVSHLEQDGQASFLRLRPFTPRLVNEYFGDDYKAAKELCINCPEMLTIPMLAYMVQTLIDKDLTQEVVNRSGLYERFINYLLDPLQYRHESLNLGIGEITDIRKAYEKISYDAIANKQHCLQNIPLKIAHQSLGIHLDRLPKLGLANLFSNTNNKSFVFNHQSYQEYLAAVYCSENGESFALVLQEKWNPKWKEVLKFITGIKGQNIIADILDEDDNAIHSKLFLAAELVPEVKYISQKVKNKIVNKLEDLLDDSLFASEAIRHLCYVDIDKAIVQLETKNEHAYDYLTLEEMVRLQGRKVVTHLQKDICGSNPVIVHFALSGFRHLKDYIDEEIISEIAALIENADGMIASSAIDTLRVLKDKINSDIAVRIISQIRNKSAYVQHSVISFLAEYKVKIGDQDNEIVTMITEMLNDKKIDQYWPMLAIAEIKEHISDKNANTLLRRHRSKKANIRCAAIKALAKMLDRYEANVADLIVNKLSDSEWSVRVEALRAIEQSNDIKKAISPKAMKSIINHLGHPDSAVRSVMIYTLGELHQYLKDNFPKAVTAILEKLDDLNKEVRSEAVDSLRIMINSSHKEIVESLIRKLEDDSSEVRCVAIKAVEELFHKDILTANDVFMTIKHMLGDPEQKVVIKTLMTMKTLDLEYDSHTISIFKSLGSSPDKRIAHLAIELLGNDSQDQIEDIARRNLLTISDRDDLYSLKRLYESGALENS